MKYKLITVNFKLPGTNAQFIEFQSEGSFLDADILAIDVRHIRSLWRDARQSSDGTWWVSLRNGARSISAQIERRRNEVAKLLLSGRIVLCFLRPVDGCRIDTSERGDYELATNYGWLPNDYKGIIELTRAGTGDSIILKKLSDPFMDYFRAFAGDLEYAAYLDMKGENTDGVYATTKTDNIVGAHFSAANGHLIFLPPPPANAQPKKIFGILLGCASAILGKAIRIPQPNWAKLEELPGELEIIDRIKKLDDEISKINSRRETIQNERAELLDFKGLLFEQGAPLEKSVKSALALLGFRCDQRQEQFAEHDVIFSSPEGRGIGEVEGKDKSAINIEKLDQLSRVVDEDFKIEDSFAQGVLIGNGYRLTEPANRQAQFTKKVCQAADHKRFGLLTTIELFKAVKAVLADKDNEELKTRFRKAILETKGKEISLTP